MTITLELSAEQERLLEEGATRRRPARQLDSADLGALLDTIASELGDLPVLSDEAASRAGIYRDHP